MTEKFGKGLMRGVLAKEVPSWPGKKRCQGALNSGDSRDNIVVSMFHYPYVTQMDSLLYKNVNQVTVKSGKSSHV